MKSILLTSFILLMLLVDSAFARVVKPGSMIVVFNDQNIPLFPIRAVDENGGLTLDDKLIDLSGVELASLLFMVKTGIGDKHPVSSVISYAEDELANITVLGDIFEPGNYVQPKLSPVWQLNYFNALYDGKSFEPDIKVIRGNREKHFTKETLKDLTVMDGDIYLVSLKKKTVVSNSNSNSNKNKPEKVKYNIDPDFSHVVTNTSTKSGSQVDMANQLRSVLAPKNKSETQKISKRTLKSPNDHLSDVIKPGDIVTINLPGEDGFNKDFLIDRDGSVTLPEVGQVSLGGMTLEEAEKAIYKSLSSVYLGLDKLSVLAKERRLLVTVLGFVKTPGQVDMPDTGNVQTAIKLAGGLKDGAQLNKLQIQRGDETIPFNYKKYLDSGDPSAIPPLQSLDTIFVPSSPNLSNVYGEASDASTGLDPTEDATAIKVFGQVYKPGSFAHIEGMTIVDAILRAGGVNRYANVEQIRLIGDGEPVLFNLKRYLDNGDAGQLPVLKEGSTIYVPIQVEAVTGGGRIVYVMGQVQKPGSFEIGEKVGFLDVLANAGGPNRHADNSMVRVLRADGNVVRFNLQEYAEGSDVKVPKIYPGDAIFIPQKSTLIDDSWLKIPTSSSVSMMGAIKKPGRYLWSEGINFMDMLSHSGGPTEKADIANVKIVSTGDDGKAISRVFNLQHFIDRGGNWSSLPSLQGGVTVIFPELPEDPSDNKSQWVRLSSDQAIYIMGAVVSPGRYAFTDQMNVLDILSAAQGPTEESDLTNIRVIHRNGLAPRVSRLNLVEYFETGDETLLPHVSSGDSIFIPSRNRSWVQKKSYETVRVLGSVKSTGRYDFTSDMNILDILAQSGGPTSTALIEKIIIVSSSSDNNQAYTFDLVEYMKNPVDGRLPVLRPGDTIFIPDVKNTKWAYFMDIVRDALGFTSIFTLLGARVWQ